LSALALAFAVAAHSTAAAPEITAISLGRADQATLIKADYTPFTKATGIGVNSMSYDGQTDELEAMVKAGKTTWDLMQVETRTLDVGCKNGLFEKLDMSRIGERKDFIPGAITDCGVGIFSWSMA